MNDKTKGRNPLKIKVKCRSRKEETKQHRSRGKVYQMGYVLKPKRHRRSEKKGVQ